MFTLGSIKNLQQTLQWQLENGTTTLESRVQLMAIAARTASFISGDGNHVVDGGPNDGWVSEAVQLITDFTEKSGQSVSDAWRDILPILFATVRDGQNIITNLTAIHPRSFFYPQWWLEMTGYFDIGGNPTGIYFEPSPISAEYIVNMPSIIAAAVVTVCGFAAGRYSSVLSRRKQYIPI